MTDASPYREGLAEQRAELDEVRAQVADARGQLVDLQRERQDSRDHRTRVQTLLGLAGAAALVVTLGAGNGNNRSAPRMRLAIPAGAVRVDVRMRIAAHTGALSWEMPGMWLESSTTFLYGVGSFAAGDTNDVRAGNFLNTTYPSAGSAPTTALSWSGNDWLRMVWADGQMTVFTGEGSGTAEPTAWERGTTVYTPTGRAPLAPDLVIAATRLTNPSDPAAGASGTLAAWTVDIAVNAYVWLP